MKITEIESKRMLHIVLCIYSILYITGVYQCYVKNLKLSCVFLCLSYILLLFHWRHGAVF